MGLGSSIIKVIITGDSRPLEVASHEATASLGKIDKSAATTGDKITAMGSKIAMAGAAAVLALGAISIKNGDALNESTDQLKNALEHQGQSVKGLSGQMNPYLKKLENWGFTNKDVTDSVTQMVHGGKTLQESLKLQALAADVAKTKHISLADAALLVTKATQGQSKALKSLGIDANIANGSAKSQALALAGVAKASDAVKLVEEKIHDGRLKGKAASDATVAAMKGLKDAQDKLTASQQGGAGVTDLLSKRLGGTAAESVKSLHGKLEVLHTKFTDFTAHLGQKLIPILLSVFNWFSKNSGIATAFGIAVGVITAGILAYTAAVKIKAVWDKAWEIGTKAVAAAQWLLNAAMSANPIMLVVIAIAALVAGVIWAYGHFKIFRDVVNAVFSFVVSIISGVVDWVSKHWPLLLAILTGPFGLAVLFISGHWDGIVDFFSRLPGRIGSVLSGVWSAITSPFRDAWNWIAGKWNAITLPKIHVPGTDIDIGGGGLPHLPTFHKGGVYLGGSGARREGLALLQDGEGIFTPAQMRALGAGVGGGGGGGVTINMPAGVDAAAVVRAQAAYNRRNGIR